MSSDLRRRLERLESGRPRPRARTRRRARAQDLPPGEEVETAEGFAYRIDTRYSADYRHGRSSLQDVLSYAPGLAAEVANDAGLERSKIQRWGFVDIETTGLSGGAGTLGFLIRCIERKSAWPLSSDPTICSASYAFGRPLT